MLRIDQLHMISVTLFEVENQFLIDIVLLNE